MNTSPIRALAGCALFALITMGAGCAHRQGASSARAPGTVATAYEKAVMYNTVLAQTNDTIIHGVIALTKAPPALTGQVGIAPISVADATRILVTQRNIAKAHQQLELILELGPGAAAGHASEITALVQQVTELTKATIAIAPLADVKDPDSKSSLISEIQSIGTLADIVVSDLIAAGVLKQ